MFLCYTRYEFVLGQKKIKATLKHKNQSENFDLCIITPAMKFLGMSMGGGLFKISRLYDENKQLVRSKHYSSEIKADIKEFKKTLKIPYFKLWIGSDNKKNRGVIMAIISTE